MENLKKELENFDREICCGGKYIVLDTSDEGVDDLVAEYVDQTISCGVNKVIFVLTGGDLTEERAVEIAQECGYKIYQ